MSSLSQNVNSYVNLTKPRIVILFAVTGVITLVAEGYSAPSAAVWILVLTAMALTAASASAFNMFIDQDIDSIMDRTRFKRAIPLGQLKPVAALQVGAITGIFAVGILYFQANLLSAALSLFTIIFYAMIYTKWLKRTTHHNTFWGGIAGATAPLMASAATTGSISPLAWSLFAIIMIWSCPHFWALAITLKEDYAKAGIPMLPVKKGEAYTRISILVYTVLLIPISILPYLLGETTVFFLATILVADVVYLAKTVEMVINKEHSYCKHLFWVSLIYITYLFIFLLVDSIFFSHLIG